MPIRAAIPCPPNENCSARPVLRVRRVSQRREELGPPSSGRAPRPAFFAREAISGLGGDGIATLPEKGMRKKPLRLPIGLFAQSPGSPVCSLPGHLPHGMVSGITDIGSKWAQTDVAEEHTLM